MHVLMTKEQFDEFKKKAPQAKMKMKEDDDTHGTLETDDANVGYFYNPYEARLVLGPVAKKKTLAAYCAGENILGTFIMDQISAIPSEKKEDKKEEKKDQEQQPA